MPPSVEQETPRDHLQEFLDALSTETVQEVHARLKRLHPAEVAHVLESIPLDEREVLWGLIEPEQHGAVLVHLNDEVRGTVIRMMDPQALVAATDTMDTDDLADLLPQFPGEVIQEVMLSLEHQEREHLQSILAYPEDTAGGIMDLDTVRVRADIPLDVVLRYLRRRGEIPETTDALYVVNREGRYQGTLGIRELITHDPELTVAEVMTRDIEGIPAETPARDVATLFERRDLVTAPVVDAEGKLLGRITIDDVVDVIRDEADQSLMGLAGVEEEDLFAPVWDKARNRWPWLAMNLGGAFIASRVVGAFEGTILQIVALASLMPIVAALGGNTGNQTIALIIRALALGRLNSSNMRLLLFKELGVSLVNGIVWGLVVALFAFAFYQDVGLALVVATAMLLNLLVAALAGVVIPLGLRALGRDPALGSTVLLTGATDSMGFLIFLGLATLILL